MRPDGGGMIVPSPRSVARALRIDAVPGTVASCPPERFIDLIGNIAPGPADVVKLSLGQPGQFAPHLGSVAPRMEDFANLAQRPSEQANSMMICHQENCFAHDGSLLTDAEAGL